MRCTLCPNCYDSFLDFGFSLRSPGSSVLNKYSPTPPLWPGLGLDYVCLVSVGRGGHHLGLPPLHWDCPLYWDRRFCPHLSSFEELPATEESIRELFRRVHAYCGSERSGGWRILAELYPSLEPAYPANSDPAAVVAWLSSIEAGEFVSFFHNFVCDTFLDWTARGCGVGCSSTWCDCGTQWVQNAGVAPPVASPASEAAPASLAPPREPLPAARRSKGWERAAAINRGKLDWSLLDIYV